MTTHIIGTKADGTLVGEDDDGTPMVGTPRNVGLDEMESNTTVAEDGLSAVIVESLDGQVFSNLRITRTKNMTDEQWAAACNPVRQKLYRQVIVIDADGKESEQRREVFRTVIDWEVM